MLRKLRISCSAVTTHLYLHYWKESSFWIIEIIKLELKYDGRKC